MRIIMYLAILTAWKIFNVEPNGKDNGLLRFIGIFVLHIRLRSDMNVEIIPTVKSGRQQNVI